MSPWTTEMCLLHPQTSNTFFRQTRNKTTQSSQAKHRKTRRREEKERLPWNGLRLEDETMRKKKNIDTNTTKRKSYFSIGLLLMVQPNIQTEYRNPLEQNSSFFLQKTTNIPQKYTTEYQIRYCKVMTRL